MEQFQPIDSIYIDPTTDFGFKKLFGEEANKDLLMDFLNSFLPYYQQIATLAFQKPEQIPVHPEDRKAIFDILCESESGEKFIIEMQKAAMSHMMDRALFYTTFPIQSQGIKGTWNFNLTPVYFVGILDFDYDINELRWGKRKLLRIFNIQDEDGILMTDKLNFKILQLPFFTKKPEELTTHFEKWCYFLKNLESFELIPNILNEPIFMKALEASKVSNLSTNDYILYQISKSKKYDMDLVKEEAQRQGMEKGRIETLIKMVFTAHINGFSSQQIGDFTKIPLDRILAILECYDEKEDLETNVTNILKRDFIA